MSIDVVTLFEGLLIGGVLVGGIWLILVLGMDTYSERLIEVVLGLTYFVVAVAAIVGFALLVVDFVRRVIP